MKASDPNGEFYMTLGFPIVECSSSDFNPPLTRLGKKNMFQLPCAGKRVRDNKRVKTILSAGKVTRTKPGLVVAVSIGSLSKPRRRRQRERRLTKGLMSKTIAVHVRYKSLYISLPSSANQEREMTKFCVVY